MFKNISLTSIAMIVIYLGGLITDALDNGFLRPPMGWSALYGAPFSRVNETIVQGAAHGLVLGGFKNAGYEYVTIDDWYAERGLDGKIRAMSDKFPSGMPATSKYVHSLGLKYGIYSAASQRTCANDSASMFLEVQDVNIFAHSWEIDFLKYDSCLYSNGVASRARYLVMRNALNSSGRSIFYSMEGCGGCAASWGPELGNMWRTGNDIWPKWDECILRNLYSNNQWAAYQRPGAFNDPDMIQASDPKLTFDEARSQFILWAVMKAPLMLGAHWSSLLSMKTDQPEYFHLLTHPEIIAINQDLSQQARLVCQMASTSQQAPGSFVNVTIQDCDPLRCDQRFEEGQSHGEYHSIKSFYGNICLSDTGDNVIIATPCDGNNGQMWTIKKDSQFHIVQSDNNNCLTPINDFLTTKTCEYTGSFPPPLNINFGDQLFVWDEKVGSIVNGRGQCITLGFPNQVSNYVTNNGTLEHEVWKGPHSTGRTVVVLFNKGTHNDTITVSTDILGFSLSKKLPVRDVWTMRDLAPVQRKLSAVVPAHGVAVFLVG